MWRRYYQPLPKGDTKGGAGAPERPESGVFKVFAINGEINANVLSSPGLPMPCSNHR